MLLLGTSPILANSVPTKSFPNVFITVQDLNQNRISANRFCIIPIKCRRILKRSLDFTTIFIDYFIFHLWPLYILLLSEFVAYSAVIIATIYPLYMIKLILVEANLISRIFNQYYFI